MAASYPVTPVYATAAPATAVTVTLPAAAAVRRAIQYIEASCSGAASTVISLSVTDGATVVYNTDITLAVGVPQTPLPAPILCTSGNAVTITLAAGAASCVGKLNVGYFDFVPSDIPTA